jgi:hypothetical protein
MSCHPNTTNALPGGTAAARHPLFAGHLWAAVCLLEPLAEGDERSPLARAWRDARAMQWEAQALPPPRFADRDEAQRRLREVRDALATGYAACGRPELWRGLAEGAMRALGDAHALAANLRPAPPRTPSAKPQ